MQIEQRPATDQETPEKGYGSARPWGLRHEDIDAAGTVIRIRKRRNSNAPG